MTASASGSPKNKWQIRPILSEIKTAVSNPLMYPIYKKFSGYTMFNSYPYIQNLLLAQKVKVDGCVVECGTWRGGMIAGFATVLGNKREYYLFDSFEGLPDATENDGELAAKYQADTKENPEYGWDNCRAEISFAEQAMKKSGVDHYQLVKGWFENTLPGFDKSKKIALLHLDGDWYDSVYLCLEQLYDSVVPGGIVIIDDYTNWEGCTKAVHDFLSKRNIPEKIKQFNNSISYFVKSA
jgi:O-methyltransferase